METHNEATCTCTRCAAIRDADAKIWRFLQENHYPFGEGRDPMKFLEAVGVDAWAIRQAALATV